MLIETCSPDLARHGCDFILPLSLVSVLIFHFRPSIHRPVLEVSYFLFDKVSDGRVLIPPSVRVSAEIRRAIRLILIH